MYFTCIATKNMPKALLPEVLALGSHVKENVPKNIRNGTVNN